MGGPDNVNEPAPPILESCRLCGLPVRGRTDGYCCSGCARAHEALQALRAAGPPPEEGGPPAGDDEGEVVVLALEGMTCPGCATLVEESLKRRPGVLEAEASFLTDRVRVRYAPHRASPAELAAAVEALGYRAREPGGDGAGPGSVSPEALRLGVSLFLTANVMMLSLSLDLGFFQEFPPDVLPFLGAPALLMASLVVFWGGASIHRRTIAAARIGRAQMETLISTASILAWGLSTANLLRGNLHLYYDTASMLVSLILLGGFIERWARRDASRAVTALSSRMPVKARVDEADGVAYVPLEALDLRRPVVVFAGETLPADGIVVAGEGLVDPSALTGESEPVVRGPGDAVLGGTVLTEGELRLRPEGVGANSAAGRMVALMHEALSSRGGVERLADRVAGPFVLVVIGIAAATAAGVGVSGGGLAEALLRAVTVLVVACPCTLGIAVPLAKVAAVGAARRQGIVIRNADALETAPRLTHLVLDKTGTATHGTFRLLALSTEGASEEETLRRAMAAEAGSRHLLARALLREGRDRGLEPLPVEAFEEEPGRGVRARVEGMEIRVGSLAFVEGAGLQVPAALAGASREAAARGSSVVVVGWEGRVRAVAAFGDRIREDMADLVAQLREDGVATWLVSGDEPRATEVVARALGVDGQLGGALPAAKAEWIRARRGEGARVAMVGDGLNDAAALASADIGIAVGGAADVTRQSSDVTLMGEAGPGVRSFLRLAAFTAGIQRRNLLFAFLYNAAAVPVAVSGLITPLVAVCAMVASSLTVVVNSSRILRKRTRP